VVHFGVNKVPSRQADADDLDALEQFYRGILIASGEDISREGLRRTPERAAKTWKFLTNGYGQDPRELVESAVFEESFSDPIVVQDIEFYSMCEHHLLPFFGKVHIAYVPSGKLIGLSKLPRLVNSLARRLQLQERLTDQIADVLAEVLSPKGIAVQIEALHLCMMMRGVEKQHSKTTTQVLRGVFAEDQRMRDMFFAQVSGRVTNNQFHYDD